jgi:hypothetical protein
MGSSHSQFAPGMVFAVSGAFCAGGGLEALYRLGSVKGVRLCGCEVVDLVCASDMYEPRRRRSVSCRRPVSSHASGLWIV